MAAHPSNPLPRPAPAWKAGWSWRLLIAGAMLTAYAGTFGVPFIFDDIAAVTQNPSLHRLVDALTPPPDLSVSGRPLANLSLAANYLAGGTAVAGYHSINLALHVACAWLIFGAVRRAAIFVGASATAVPLAASTALIWALHPLATAAVTYVMQRTELLVSCGALATVYAFVRSVAANQSPARGRGWMAVAVLNCAAAMAAKEVAVVIPLLVLLVDRTLHRESTLMEQLIRRRAFYAALAATWLILGALLALSPGRGASAGVASGMVWTDYALNQVAGIATYLGLSIWPTPLIFDRGDSLLPLGAATVAGGGLLLSIVFGSVWAWRRWPLVAAMLLWFLLLLAPSSSVVPIATQILGEHRLYLALLGLVFLATAIALRLLGPRRLVLASCALALPLLLLTVRRNRDFATLESIWADTARKAPTNARAHYNLGLASEVAGKTDQAIAAYQACVLLSPQHADAHAHLARLLQRTGRHREAIPHFEAAVRAKPDCALHNEAAVSLLMSGDAPAAVTHFAASLQLNDAQPLVHYNLGLALQRAGKYAEALAHFESTIRLSPDDGDAQRAAARLREFLRQ